MDAKTPREFFDNVLPARFKPENSAGIDVIAQMIITGEKGGNWVVTVKNQQIQIKEGIDPAPTLTLEVEDNDFMDLMNKKLSAQKAFFTGKIKFKGNIAIALKLKEAGFL
jgi:putative sterol carrier protein